MYKRALTTWIDCQFRHQETSYSLSYSSHSEVNKWQEVPISVIISKNATRSEYLVLLWVHCHPGNAPEQKLQVYSAFVDHLLEWKSQCTEIGPSEGVSDSSFPCWAYVTYDSLSNIQLPIFLQLKAPIHRGWNSFPLGMGWVLCKFCSDVISFPWQDCFCGAKE